jgi:propanediol dehydratase large subunit
MKQWVVVASGSYDSTSFSPRDSALISAGITSRGITVLEVILALHAKGFAE